MKVKSQKEVELQASATQGRSEEISHTSGVVETSQDGEIDVEITSSHQQGLSPDMLRYRKNPVNGNDCFFSEDSFRRVMGPEPSLEQKLLLQLSRLKTDKKKSRSKDLDKPKETVATIGATTTELPGAATTEHVKEELISDNVLNGSDTQPSPDSVQMCNGSQSFPDKLSTNSLIDGHVELELASDSQGKVTADVPDEREDGIFSAPSETEPAVSGQCLRQEEHSDNPEAGDELLISGTEDLSVKCTKSSSEVTEALPSSTPPHPGILGIGDMPNSPAGDTSELCLVLPSLSSDEDDDETSDNNSFLYPSRIQNVSTVTSELNNAQSVQAELDPHVRENMTMLPIPNVNQSFDNHTTIGHTSSLPSEQNLHTCNSVSAYQSNPYTMSWHTIVHNASAMESQMQSWSQAASPAKTSFPYNVTNMGQASSAPASWSENDIPIFSFKEASPEAGKGETRSHKKNSVWSLEVASPADKTTSVESASGDSTTAKEAVKKALKFKQSDLTKAEHKKYLMFFNRYVKPYMLGGQPPVFTQRQLNELSVFEKLQRRVLDEQTEFQTYLHDNAKRNPQFYSFMKKAARHYASSKARSYHLNKKHTLKFSQNVQAKISLRPGQDFSELKFVQTLLEVGVPPRISLPDIQSGNKPEAIPHNIKKLDSWFPRQSRKNVPGHIHHEPVSFDTNVKNLVRKYNVQVVMSSSVVKCLVDNHGPNFDRAWHIPVTVLDHDSEDQRHHVVYLDKPVFDDSLLTRDYNTLFHKYCLRTFVSHPKHRRTKEVIFPRPSPRNLSTLVDDPFDMFATDIDSLETFGARLDKPLDVASAEEMGNKLSNASSETHQKREERTDAEDLNSPHMDGFSSRMSKRGIACAKKSEDIQENISLQEQPRNNSCEKDIKTNETNPVKAGRVLRSVTRWKTPGTVEGKVDGSSADHLMPRLRNVSKTDRSESCTDADNLVNAKSVDAHSVSDKPTTVDVDSESDKQIIVDTDNPDSSFSESRRRTSSCEPASKRQKSGEFCIKMNSESVISQRRRSTRLVRKRSDSQSSMGQKIELSNKDHTAAETTTLQVNRKRKSADSLFDDKDISSENVETQESGKKQSGSQSKANSTASLWSRGEDRLPVHHPDKTRESTGHRETDKTADNTPSSPETPLSPIASPSSPPPPTSPPASPSEDGDNIHSHLLSGQTLSSAVREIPSSPVHDNTRLSSPPTIPLSPPQDSVTRKKLKLSPTSSTSHQYHRMSNTRLGQRVCGGVQSKLFSPLDSILGPSFGSVSEKDKQTLPREDPSHYLPPTEVSSSIVYNLWCLDDISVLIRSRCQGILKDHKKTRRVYLSPKMEYQTAYGLEQVTVSEMARDWAACFVRPNTNLLRARINTFTSEIMMFEELETHQILQSSFDFKPEQTFQFLSSLLQQLTSLECGKYLLSHEPGTDYCGIHCQRQGVSSERPDGEDMIAQKKSGVDSVLRWIPIDPTLLLPYHTANNRIPATFLPKDFVVTNFKSGGQKNKGRGNQRKDMNTQSQGGGQQGSYKNKGKRKN